MSTTPTHRTLRQSEVFSSALDHLPTDGPVAAALDGLIWGIATGPDKFDLIPDSNPGLYLAKTDDAFLGKGTLRIWFEIVDANTVELKFMEFLATDTGGDDEEED